MAVQGQNGRGGEVSSRKQPFFHFAFVAALSTSSLLAAPPASHAQKSSLPGVERPATDGGAEAQDAIPAEMAISALPEDAVFRRVTVLAGGGRVASVGEPGQLVYSNTQGRILLGASAGSRIADDIVPAAVGGCLLDRYVTRVSGDRDGSRTNLDTPYSVTLALYPSCPGASATPQPIPNTSVTVDFPDGRYYEIEVVVAPGVNVSLPPGFFLATTFDRVTAGVVVGAPATTGYSCDQLDFPGFPCSGRLGGYPEREHASFYAQVYARGSCAFAFPGYYVNRETWLAFTEGTDQYFAVDLQLAVSNCQLIGYDVAVKGKNEDASGIVETTLHSTLDPVDPYDGGAIPETRASLAVNGAQIRYIRVSPVSPVSIPDALWVVFKTSSDVVGPIVAGQLPCIGTNINRYMRYTSDGGAGQWEPSTLPGQVFPSMNVTLWCAGEPPAGACCDSRFGNEQGNPVCRQSAAMNCLGNRWAQGALCVDEPFVPACGLGACCTPDDTCEVLTEDQCAALSPPGDEVTWVRDATCESVEETCPFYACRNGTGDCAEPRDGPGCWNEPTCMAVCNADPYCCRVAWDDVCVGLMQDLRPSSPFNDRCFSTDAERGARKLAMGDTVVISNAGAGGTNPSPFCCGHLPGEYAGGDIWFTFAATDTSARIATCGSRPADLDTLVQVFRPVDPTTPESACETLDPVACHDDALGCGGGRLASVCVTDLVPSETYYVLVAGKTPLDDGLLQVTIDAPCESDVVHAENDSCHDAVPIQTGVFPFDFQDATFNCPGSGCLESMEAMGRDLWYAWDPPTWGIAQITTCGDSDATTPDTSLVVYESCECPPSDDTIIGCDEHQYSPCLGGSSVGFRVNAFACYLIRVGVHADDDATGNLTVAYQCPADPVYFLDPPPGLVDARQPNEPDVGGPPQGISSVTVRPPNGGAHRLACWSVCETGDAAIPNSIVATEYNRDWTMRIDLARPMTPGQITTIAYTDHLGRVQSAQYVVHPGNVNGDAVTDAEDVSALLAILAGEAAPAWDLYSTDIDHSGRLTPGDVLRLIDVLNGGDAYEPGWRGTSLPVNEGLCP